MPSPSRLLFAALIASTIAPVAPATEVPLAFTPVEIGDARPGHKHVITPGRDIDITGYGTMFALHVPSDLGHFEYMRIKGDFDFTTQVYAIESEVQSHCEAGLLVRRDLTPSGLEIGQFVTSNFKGESDQYTFLYRLREGGCFEPMDTMWHANFFGPGIHGNATFAYSATGYDEHLPRPRPFPYVYLRLTRVGNHYTGYLREYNETEWRKLGEVTLDLGEEPYVGLAIMANHHDPSRPGNFGDPEKATTAAFRHLSLTQPSREHEPVPATKD